MQRIKSFICYSSKDHKFAETILAYIENCLGFEVFLANDKLTLSDNWPKEIWKNLTGTDFFIPLISKNFMLSFFANQELGVAVGIGKKIIPISIDGINPDGLIRDKQGFKCEKWDHYSFIKCVTEIFNLPLKHPKYTVYKQKAINSLIYALENSNHYTNSNIIVSMFPEIHKIQEFDNDQLTRIKNAAKNNSNVYGADIIVMPKLKKFLQENYTLSLD